ncbi:MAG: hypothetical protein Q7S71_03895 [Candidatus Nitrotoga sp.]|nr:hypothetical protein [Candidatus Nitrotoga sp.]
MDFIVITRYGTPEGGTKGYSAAKQGRLRTTTARIRNRMSHGSHIVYIISAKLTCRLHMPLPSRSLG